jgi:DNA-binding MurR/RpiR family transcriptional regulator
MYCFHLAWIKKQMVQALGDDFSARLAAAQAHLSPKMAQLAAFVSEHYRQVAFMSTRELAAAAGDVLIAMAFAHRPTDLMSLVRYAHGLGVRILAITDSPLSPILPLAEVALVAKATRLDFVGSLAAPAALINCVVSELGMRLGEVALERLQALEDAARAAGTYMPAGSRSAPVPGRRLAWDDERLEGASQRPIAKRSDK